MTDIRGTKREAQAAVEDSIKQTGRANLAD